MRHCFPNKCTHINKNLHGLKQSLGNALVWQLSHCLLQSSLPLAFDVFYRIPWNFWKILARIYIVPLRRITQPGLVHKSANNLFSKQNFIWYFYVSQTILNDCCFVRDLHTLFTCGLLSEVGKQQRKSKEIFARIFDLWSVSQSV